MKKNLLVLVLATFTAGSMVAEHEPVLAETVEMPGNVVGSLFGGGYAKRSHDKKVKKESTSPSTKKSSKQTKDSKKSHRSRRRPDREQNEK